MAYRVRNTEHQWVVVDWNDSARNEKIVHFISEKEASADENDVDNIEIHKK